MRRHLLTGAPGSGKTTVLALLHRRGLTTVAEAATDLIAAAQAGGVDRPWTDPAFPERIAAEQARRQAAADLLPGPDQFFDRSPVCTLALARFLDLPVGPVLAAELDRIRTHRVYQRTVYYFDQLATITPTAARRISLADAAAFAQVHLDAYTSLGYTLEHLPPASPRERAERITDLTGAA